MLGSSAFLISIPSRICPTPAKLLFLGLFICPKPFADGISLQGTWSAVIGRRALNLSCQSQTLPRSVSDPSRVKPSTLRFLGSFILESGCCIAGKLIVVMLMKLTSENDPNFRSFCDIRLKMATKLCARESQDKSLLQLYLHITSSLLRDGDSRTSIII